ncbi:MAG: hypothetical protein SF028_01715 [Candidatus Sumerlaeia bacterium]|nr:hypothetical protein [Candidatus Sumerlaeia bacterium]
MNRATRRFLAVLLTLLVAMLAGLADVRSQAPGTGANAQRVEDLKERIRNQYIQGNYQGVVATGRELLSVDPGNNNAAYYIRMAEDRMAAGDTAPPVVAATPTPRPVATPIPIVQPPVLAPRRRSRFDMDDLLSNPIALGVVGLIGILLVVAVILGIALLIRRRREAAGAAVQRDRPTVAGLGYGAATGALMGDMPTRPGLGDMPTLPEGKTAPQPAGGVLADRNTATAPQPFAMPGMVEGTPNTQEFYAEFGESNAPPSTPEAYSETDVVVPPGRISRGSIPVSGVVGEPERPMSMVGEFSASTDYDASDSQSQDVIGTKPGGLSSKPGAPPLPPGGDIASAQTLAFPPMPLEPEAPADSLDLAGFADVAPLPPVAAGDDTLAFAGVDDRAPGEFSSVSLDGFGSPAPQPTAEEQDDPNAMSFSSLMFAETSAPGLSLNPPAPATGDDLSNTQFGAQFADVMMGAGTEEAKAPEAPAPKAPPAQAGEVTGQDATVDLSPKASPDGGAKSMFARQYDAGKAAFDQGDFVRAVQCLSVAASLRPTDMEVRSLLDEARKRRR